MMTSALMQTATTANTTSAVVNESAATLDGWPNDKLRFSCYDNIGWKQLWRLIALEPTTATAKAKAKAKPTTATQTTLATTSSTTTSAFNTTTTTNMKLKTKLKPRNHEICNRHLANSIVGKIKTKTTKTTKTTKPTTTTTTTTDVHTYVQINKSFDNVIKICDRNDSKANQYHQIDENGAIANERKWFLQFFAINALDLSAPATPVLLEQHESCQQWQQSERKLLIKPLHNWLQLSGHPESIVPTTNGIVRKRVSGCTDNEVLAYQQLSCEVATREIVPQFHGVLRNESGETFIELQDLLSNFKDPCVMDIKMGSRTFLESEVSNSALRSDLYEKMKAIDPNAFTIGENDARGVTKLRYMLFREAMSSSQTKAFRIEALRLRDGPPIKDLKTVRTSEQIEQTFVQFIGQHRNVQKELIKRLKFMRDIIERSPFFRSHEIIGSSIFIVYDDEHVGCWLIDFAKSRPLPSDIIVNHRSTWLPGNHEEGLLKGFDELIKTFEHIYAQKNGFLNKCL